jgi:alanine racemase
MGGARRPVERPTWATVRTDAIRANFGEARRRAEGRVVIGVVKADGYGHGALPAARALVEAVGGFHEHPELAVQGGLTPVIHHRHQLEQLVAAARGRGAPVPVQVEVDTGMRRMGIPPAEAEGLLAAVAEEPAVALEGVYTHFARGDEADLGPTLEQIAIFRRVLAAVRQRGIRPPLIHCAHSAALLAGRPVFEALPEANAVRPGLMLFGVHPAPHLEAELRPALTLHTRVAHVRAVARGEAVGYSALFRAERPTRVATLPLGYADGVPVGISNRGSVLIGGLRHPIVGRVSMDFVSVDVGDAPVAIGHEAIVFGEGPQGRLPVEEAAAAADTIPYELLVRVGARVPRIVGE